MPRRGRKHGTKAEDVVSCPGFVDEHGQWNNGFHCPKWGGPDQAYCCGTETHLYCCPKPDDFGKPTGLSQHVPLIVGVSVGSVVLMTTTFILTCYFCRCCWAYKRRKTRNQGVPGCSVHGRRARGLDYAVNYSVCPHQAYPQVSHSEDYNDLYGVNRAGNLPMYPLDDPPPYPGEPPYTAAEEKQPLNPSDLVVMTEGPDDTPVTVAVGRGASDAIFMQDLSSRGNGPCMPHSLSGVSPFEDCDTVNATAVAAAELRPNLATPRYVTSPTDSRYQDDRSTCSSAAAAGHVPSLGNGRYTINDSSAKVSNGAHNNQHKRHNQRHYGSSSGNSDTSSPEEINNQVAKRGCRGNPYNPYDVINGASSSRGCASQSPLPHCHCLPSPDNNPSSSCPSPPLSAIPQG